MDEYSGLAQRVAVAVGDVHACVVMSSDGMILGSHPEGDETAVKAAWLRFAGLGQVDKGFIEFADQVWVYVHRGPYAAFAVAGSQVRPGLLMDQLEQALLSAEESRTRREPLRMPEAGQAPSGKPRTSLHPASERAADQVRAGTRSSTKDAEPGPAAAGASPDAEGTQREPGPEPEPARPTQPLQAEAGDDDSEVDPVLLAKEFSGLLQVPEEPDEGSS